MKGKKLNITAIVEEVAIPREDPEFRSKPKQPSMEHDVLRALRRMGHQVQVLGIFDRIEPMVEGIEKNPPDLVFNLAEQFANDRRHDKHVAGLLEMMDIPFTGTGSAGLMLSRDKALGKQLLSTVGLYVPGFWIFPYGKTIGKTLGRQVHVPRSVHYPLVVKPTYGDGSEGISNASLVHDDLSLKLRIEMLHERFKQDVIAEEYIEGHEIYVGVLGNQRLQVLPPYEIRFGNQDEGGPVLATYRVKWNKEYRDKWNIQFGFADLPKKLADKVAHVCRKAYRLLQLRDYARLDLRITPREEVFVIEANPNPDITQGEEVAEAARKAGMGYQRFINRIVRHALVRHGQAT
jgi:D-alanine-D-alanine ligase